MFPSGHPSKYWLGSTLLNFSDRTRTGVFSVIWPLAKEGARNILFQFETNFLTAFFVIFHTFSYIFITFGRFQRIFRGLARTQIPTNRNYAVEFHTFGEIAGVNHSEVQWSSLALGKPPCWSWLIPRPGKYAFKASLGKGLRTTKLTLLLSPAPGRSPLCQDGQYLTPIFHPWWTLEKLKAREIQKIHTRMHPLAGMDWKSDSLLQVRHL